MADAFGLGEVSNSKEISAFKEKLKKLGVELIQSETEALAYPQELRSGEPGMVCVSNGASYRAWCREMKHVGDDYADGWFGMRVFQELKNA